MLIRLDWQDAGLPYALVRFDEDFSGHSIAAEPGSLDQTRPVPAWNAGAKPHRSGVNRAAQTEIFRECSGARPEIDDVRDSRHAFSIRLYRFSVNTPVSFFAAIADGMPARMKTVFTPDTEAGRLALARRSAGFKTAAAAARALKVNEITYRTHETGARGYDLETAIAYAKLFSADPYYLKFGKGEPSKDGQLRMSLSAMVAMIAEGVRIARAAPGLDPEYLADIVIEALSEFAAETDVTDPAQFARIRLGFLKQRSGAE